MLIRCDRCSTLYELDETLLAPEGSPVQCTRCEHVFTARPPGAAAQGEAEPPVEANSEGPREAASEPGPRRPEPPPPLDEDDDVPDLPPAHPAAASPVGSARQPAPPQRWDRPGPPVYRPGGGAASAPAGVTRPPQIRRDAVGAFEARLRRNARWKWLGPALVVLAIAAIVAAWLLFSRRQGPVTERMRAEGLALVALDDAASLDQAVARFDESLQVAPKGREAEADRALAQVLRATALLEDGEALSARAAVSQAADRAAVAAAQPADPQAAGAAEEPAPTAATAPSPATAQLLTEARDRAGRGADLSRKAQQTLHKLEAEKVAVLEVARALALQHAAAGERDAAQRYLAAGRAKAADDPWLGLAEATLDVRARDRAGRERGVAELSALTARHPELLRARYLMAAALATLGRRAEAQAAVDAILAANPRHERAEALRVELARAPVAPAVPAQAAAGPGAASGNAVTAPRNVASQPATPRATVAPGGAPAPAGFQAPRVAREARPEKTGPTMPTGTAGALGAARKPPPGASPAAGSAPAAARQAPLRLRPRPAPEPRPVEFGAGR